MLICHERGQCHVNVLVIEVEFLMCLNYCFVIYCVLYSMFYCGFVSAIDFVFLSNIRTGASQGNLFLIKSRSHLHRLG